MRSVLVYLLLFSQAALGETGAYLCSKNYARMLRAGEETGLPTIVWTRDTPELQLAPGLSRVGRDNLSYKRIDPLTYEVQVKLPDGAPHAIIVRQHGVSAFTQGLVDEHMVRSIGLDRLPHQSIHKLKEVHLQPMGDVAGEVRLRNPGTILLNDQLAYKGYVAHELGHVIQMRVKNFWLKWRLAKRADKNSVSPYGEVNILEDFSEALHAYLEPSEEIRRLYRAKYPNRFNYLDEILRGEHDVKFSVANFLFADFRLTAVLAFSAAGVGMGAKIFTTPAEK